MSAPPKKAAAPGRNRGASERVEDNGSAPVRHRPTSPDAERSLIGAALLGYPVADLEPLGVTVDTIDDPALAAIWQAVADLERAGQPVDPVLLRNHLLKSGAIPKLIDDNATLLADLQQHTPAIANAPSYAEIVVDHHHRRRLQALGLDLAQAALDGRPVGELIDQMTAHATWPGHNLIRYATGGAAVLDQPDGIPAVWGRGPEVFWPEGEPFMMVSPTGVGKTTITGQLVRGLVGLQTKLLGYPIATRNRVLYIAADRPQQITRSLRRHFTEADRDILDDKLRIWRGPPPADFGQHPETLLQMCRAVGADTVIIDSLKDVAVGLVDDTVGANLNRAVQLCVTDGIAVLEQHHQRKGQNGAKPKTLEDVYGSTWITAGTGSVVLLWGQAGDLVVELTHLKQPSETIGPLKLAHDHTAGETSVHRGFDAVTFLQHRGAAGATAMETARAWFEKQKPTDSERLKATRKLDGLVKSGHAEIVVDPSVGGAGGSTARRYRAAGISRP